MEDEIKKLKEQHYFNYKTSVKEIINNNTNVLVDEDIMLLIKKPPLDSMDIIKMKFIEIAKKNKFIINTEYVDELLLNYRKSFEICCSNIRDLRINTLTNIIDKLATDKSELFKIRKQDLTPINKKIREILKSKHMELIEKNIIDYNHIFSNVEDQEKLKKISNDISKYLKGQYLRQFLENVDFKILVKDTTLINGIKEQTERYLFTLENSRLFKENLGN